MSRFILPIGMSGYYLIVMLLNGEWIGGEVDTEVWYLVGSILFGQIRRHMIGLQLR